MMFVCGNCVGGNSLVGVTFTFTYSFLSHKLCMVNTGALTSFFCSEHQHIEEKNNCQNTVFHTSLKEDYNLK